MYIDLTRWTFSYLDWFYFVYHVVIIKLWINSMENSASITLLWTKKDRNGSSLHYTYVRSRVKCDQQVFFSYYTLYKNILFNKGISASYAGAAQRYSNCPMWWTIFPDKPNKKLFIKGFEIQIQQNWDSVELFC